MGGFAVYDNNKFHGYIWKNGEVGRNSNKGGIDSTVRARIKKRHLQMVTAGLDTRPEEKDEESSVAPETGEMRLIAGTGSESADHIESKSLNNNADLLEFLIKHGYITITEDEIMDNLSHSDSITKVIAVIQTAWFLLQVGARAVEGLAITELEIITVGFAVLNFGTYFLWWNKPLRVRHPVRVYWRYQEIAGKNDKDSENKDAKGWIDKAREFVVGIWTSVQDAFFELWESIIVLFNFLKNPGPRTRVQLNNKTFPGINWVTLLQLVGLPFLVVFRLITASILIIIDGDNEAAMAFVVNPSRLERKSVTLYILVYGLTTLFGAIHCIPWNFQFPTHTEQLLWRISAGGLVVLPIGAIDITVIIGGTIGLIKCCGKDFEEYMGPLGGIIVFLLLPIAYFVARVILMVLALMELRNLPQSAYQTVQWTTFIPHIG
ncbi:hypothetical protein VNI00_017627 [Paramarasmius palmivorus]|uniref:Uncharacterized protein n=1 Tax=Paramarasmius palmivorus TaxID=297713 RepID=A0AAW0B6Z0_9AGAR